MEVAADPFRIGSAHPGSWPIRRVGKSRQLAILSIKDARNAAVPQTE
jgi:hypothetical protein